MLSDERLRAHLDKTAWFEGRISFAYRDSLGNVTVGIGCLVRDETAMSALPFKVAPLSRAATAMEKVAEFRRLLLLPCGPTFPARTFRAQGKTPYLYMEDADIDKLALQRYRACYASLRQLFPSFDSYPATAQGALLDMAYQHGVGKLSAPADRGGFPQFIACVKARDWYGAARACHAKVSARRNAWRALQFRAAAT